MLQQTVQLALRLNN